jgi:X-X-X-Leu-X-X-Gly heptad repeats/X-X-X-Leu-X-X-Gly heptad repeats/X-X-X-Leu-X-X-Gly heptad repeats/X-X-X-Leu-X-X-Gly heptad repeats
VDATKAQISDAINATDSNSGYSLVSGMEALSQGTQTMSDSMPALTDGIGQLTNGAAQLVSNNSALVDGASKLSSATSQVEEGVKKLDDGSKELMDGMIQFDEEGIQKLTEAYDGDVKELLNRLKAVVNAGEDYQTFTKVAHGVKGSVKFIFRTDAVKTEEK